MSSVTYVRFSQYELVKSAFGFRRGRSKVSEQFPRTRWYTASQGNHGKQACQRHHCHPCQNTAQDPQRARACSGRRWRLVPRRTHGGSRCGPRCVAIRCLEPHDALRRQMQLRERACHRNIAAHSAMVVARARRGRSHQHRCAQSWRRPIVAPASRRRSATRGTKTNRPRSCRGS